MDKSAGTFYTSEIKKQPMWRLKRRAPGPGRGKVSNTRDKQMVPVIFDNKVLIYTYSRPRPRRSTPTTLRRP